MLHRGSLLLAFHHLILGVIPVRPGVLTEYYAPPDLIRALTHNHLVNTAKETGSDMVPDPSMHALTPALQMCSSTQPMSSSKKPRGDASVEIL